jgi:hypothetical protein
MGVSPFRYRLGNASKSSGAIQLKKWNSLILIILYLSLGACSSIKPSEEITSIAYCDLVVNPSLYDGQTVRVSANYVVGFEWAYLSDEKCPSGQDNTTKIWIMIPGKANLCEDVAQVNTSLPPKINRSESLEREVTITGIFQNSNGGHLGRYPLTMEFICLNEAGKWRAVQ